MVTINAFMVVLFMHVIIFIFYYFHILYYERFIKIVVTIYYII